MSSRLVAFLRRRRGALVGVTLVLLTVAGGWTAVQVGRAAAAGTRGKSHLVSAESAIADGDVEQAYAALDLAEAEFRQAKADVRTLGPVRSVARAIPIVRAQVKAAESFASAGIELTTAGRNIVVAADDLLEPSNRRGAVEQAVAGLSATRLLLNEAADALEDAAQRVIDLDGLFLVGTLDTARKELAAELGPALERVQHAEKAMDALLVFLGADGDRRWLVISQNPDEQRPLGGFIGTIGLLETDGREPKITYHSGIQEWQSQHPSVLAPSDEVTAAFLVPDERVPMYMANVNATFDWAASADLAVRLWDQAGEPPVDGVLSLTPEALARIVGVVGQVPVPGYDEILTEDNFVARLDYHTHERGEGADDPAGKQFVADSAEAVLEAMINAPTEQWFDLGNALVAAFTTREAIAWSTDPVVATALATNRWDSRLPTNGGDFVAYGEFAYASKNGRKLQRTFDHDVTVHDDGSAIVRTTVTIANHGEPGIYNIDGQAYLSMHGPLGAELSEGSDEWLAFEKPVSGHPGAGWVRAVPPGETTSLTVEWEVPSLLLADDNGLLAYRLRWWRVVGNRGDTVNLRVHLPDGWTWAGEQPPAQIGLERDFFGGWFIDRAR